MNIRSLLVTGGCGFIGSAFIRKTYKMDPKIRIVNLDLLTYAGNRKNVENAEQNPNYEFIQGDICDQPLVEAILSTGIDAIVHFAAETHVDRSIASALPFIETNVKGTLSLLEAARKFSKVHFHHVSTDEVYGSLGSHGRFSEDSPYLPNSPYAASKAASDHLVRAFAKTYGLSTTISHCSNNYGPYQYPEKLIPLMLARCIQEKPLPIYGDGTNVREWIYVDDHVDAIWAILQKGKVGETYDVGGQVEMSNLELVHLLTHLVAKELQKDVAIYRSLIQFVPDRLGHDFRYAIAGEKIARECGWSAATPFHQGLQETIRLSLQS